MASSTFSLKYDPIRAISIGWPLQMSWISSAATGKSLLVFSDFLNKSKDSVLENPVFT